MAFPYWPAIAERCPRPWAMPGSCSRSLIGARQPSSVVPTAQEVAPWVAVIERLWDDAEFEAEHRRRALAEAKRWDGDKLAEQYEGFFRSLCRGGARLSVRIS